MKPRYLIVGAFVLVLGLLAGSAGHLGIGLAAPETVLPGSEQDPLVTRTYVEEKLALKVVELPAGRRLIAGAGTELIVRAGSAVVVDSQSGGLSDVTDGVDLRKGAKAPNNHLLIVPRDDGRGLLAENAVILLVRGDYRIE